MGRSKRLELERAFEGRAVLDELLQLAGAPLDTDGVVVRMREGIRKGERTSEVIPSVFEGEPRFPDPSLARRTFQNLLGLWDLVSAGKPIPADEAIAGAAHPKREKKPRPTPPSRFPDGGPDDAWVEAAWKYLEEAPERDVQRLEHSFENRQDALVGLLDEEGFSDEGFSLARHLLFELHAMIELGWPSGVGSVAREDLAADSGKGGPGRAAPQALQAYADEALFEAEQDEEAPLAPAELGRVRALVNQGLRAFWNARRPRKEGEGDDAERPRSRS
jgi:hypothetical protein